MRLSVYRCPSPRLWILALISIVALLSILRNSTSPRVDDLLNRVGARSVNRNLDVVDSERVSPNIPDEAELTGLPDEVIFTPSPTKNDTLKLPTFQDLLPHLSIAGALQPSMVYPTQSTRRDVRLVIGVPTVSRANNTYLSQTLQSLAFGLTDEQKLTTLIVIMIGSREGAGTRAVSERIQSLDAEFAEYLSSGLFRVIVPSKEWYPPDLDSVVPNLGDSPQRMYWRTKQNLDYMFLMTYCRGISEYYLQVEDDVLTKTGYVTKIMNSVLSKGKTDWFLWEFSSLGFIGKLFRSSDLAYLLHFMALLYRHRPVDWILDTVFINRYCAIDETPKKCYQLSKEHRRSGPILFQHIGLESSLEGKVQKLKEKNFKMSDQFSAHTDNPAATVTTNLNGFKNLDIQDLYNGQSMFWSDGPPDIGSFIQINFNQSTNVKGILVRSGSVEHPSDKLDHNSVVLCSVTGQGGGLDEVVSFNDRGVARHEFEQPTPLDVIRIEMRTNYTTWLIISELQIKRL